MNICNATFVKRLPHIWYYKGKCHVCLSILTSIKHNDILYHSVDNISSVITKLQMEVILIDYVYATQSESIFKALSIYDLRY